MYMHCLRDMTLLFRLHEFLQGVNCSNNLRSQYLEIKHILRIKLWCGMLYFENYKLTMQMLQKERYNADRFYFIFYVILPTIVDNLDSS